MPAFENVIKFYTQVLKLPQHIKSFKGQLGRTNFSKIFVELSKFRKEMDETFTAFQCQKRNGMVPFKEYYVKEIDQLKQQLLKNGSHIGSSDIEPDIAKQLDDIRR